MELLIYSRSLWISQRTRNDESVDAQEKVLIRHKVKGKRLPLAEFQVMRLAMRAEDANKKFGVLSVN